MRRRGMSAVAVAVIFGSSVARADPNETPVVRADRLFKEGKAALEAKRYAEACSKLAESQHLDPAPGTLLALALCHESSRKIATAWHEFDEVVVASQAAGRADRIAFARQHLHALEPRLSTLTISVAPSDDSVDVRCDGEPVARTRWGEPMPMDGGSHVVEASAAGKAPWRATVTVADENDRQSVAVPRLGDASSSESTAAGVTAEPPSPIPQKTIALAVGGAGVVALGIGVVFGVEAISDRSSAKDGCPSSPCGNKDAVAKNDSAKTEAWVANIGVLLGLAGIGAGAYLLLRPPAKQTAPVALSFTGTGAVLAGGF